MDKSRILLGPAGSPAKSTLEGISSVKKLGLQAMEVEFVRGVKMSNELAKQVGEESRRLGIELSVHAPYFINLTSVEEKKIRESKQRILDSCERASFLALKKRELVNVVFHPAYYGNYTKEETYKIVKAEVLDMMKIIKRKKWRVQLAPETTGKISQFGTLDELMKMVKELRCSICIDPAHIYARNNGKIDYTEVLEKLEKLKLRHIHFHFSNINYNEKGEKSHLVLDSKPAFEPLAKEILERELNVTIISESPITWKDSLKMKKIFEKLGYKFN